MQQISFKYFMNLQIRFIRLMAFKNHQPELEIALRFAPTLREKIESKYIITT